jgi:putative membrane protein
MHVNYITLMLISLSAGMFLVGTFLLRGLGTDEGRDWVPGFVAAGLILAITGLHMTLTWPVPGAYNIAFGEMALLFGALLLAMAGILVWGQNPLPLGILAVLAGIAAVVVGIRIMNLGMTLQPVVAGLGFIASGLVGILSVPAYAMRGLPQIRALAMILALLAGLLWAWMGYMAYWSHLDEYAPWKVPGMQQQPESQT